MRDRRGLLQAEVTSDRMTRSDQQLPDPGEKMDTLKKSKLKNNQTVKACFSIVLLLALSYITRLTRHMRLLGKMILQKSKMRNIESPNERSRA